MSVHVPATRADDRRPVTTVVTKPSVDLTLGELAEDRARLCFRRMEEEVG